MIKITTIIWWILFILIAILGAICAVSMRFDGFILSIITELIFCVYGLFHLDSKTN
jgi:hypothetical protein